MLALWFAFWDAADWPEVLVPLPLVATRLPVYHSRDEINRIFGEPRLQMRGDPRSDEAHYTVEEVIRERAN